MTACARILLLTAAVLVNSSCVTPASVEPPAPPASPEPPEWVQNLQLQAFDYAWQRVKDAHPDPKMRGLDWDAVKRELRPRANTATTAESLRPILRDMLSRIGDSHYAVIPSEVMAAVEAPREASDAPEVANDRRVTGAREDRSASKLDKGNKSKKGASSTLARGPGDLGFDLRILDGRAIVSRVEPGGPAAQAGVKPGFALKEIRGVAVDGLLEQLARRLPAPGDLELFGRSAVAGGLEGRAGGRVPVLLEDGRGALVRVEMVRRPLPGRAVRIGHFSEESVRFESRTLGPDGGRVGYVAFNAFLPPIPAEMASSVKRFAAEGVKGIVIDLRGNPGGLLTMVMGLAGHFIDARGVSLGTIVMRDSELRIIVNPRLRAERFAGPLAILIDPESASTSEVLAGGLQRVGRARVFGQTSAGKSVPSIVEALPNGDLLQFAMADLVGPDGVRIEGAGVTPDQVVPRTRQAWLAGRDPVLEAALTWIAGAAPR